MTDGEKHLGAAITRALKKIGSSVSRQVAPIKKADPSPPDDDLSSLEIDWSPIAAAAASELPLVAEDGARQTLGEIGIADDSSITEQTFAKAVHWSRERSAELVGKSWDEHGELVDNPDAEMSIDESTRDEIRSAVADALENGDSAAELGDSIESLGAFSEERALLIARTEIIRSHAQGQMTAMRESGVVDQKAWSTAGEDVCDDCSENEDEGPVDLEDSFPSGDDAPPAHPACLPGHCLVTPSGEVAGTSKRWYDGSLYVLRTASGNELTCTPNHPILTRRGWVPASLLNVGDEVVSAREWMTVRDNDHENVPARIEDVAESFGRARGVTATEVPLSPEDFHGDGIGSQVAVVWADRTLRDGVNASDGEGHRDLCLQVARTEAKPLSRVGRLGQFFNRLLSAAHRLMRRFDLCASFRASHSRPSHSLGLALSPALHSSLQEHTSDRGAADVVLPREFELAGAGQVFADELLHIDVITTGCHVFNLQTTQGYYVAEGIVTHNCRCVVVAVILPSEGEGEESDEEDEGESDEESAA